MNLSLLILLPLCTAIAILVMRNTTYVRWTALTGATLQFLLAFVLLIFFNNERAGGNTAQMLF
jgi:NADH:ubiquinone oxidoreductase subunit 4 (subunit M)